jgi:hypothetical protein
VQCLVNPHLTNRSIREEPQGQKKPETKEIKKREEKFHLENVIDYPTLDTYIKKSVTQLSVWLVG